MKRPVSPVSPVNPVSPDEPRATLRFAEKRELILDGAARLFNRRGIKAGTLAEVAASVGLATNSLTYYYRKKEDLVCACLLRSIHALDGLVADAASADTLAQRVQVLVHAFIGLMADVAERRRPALIFFGDMRALPQPQAAPVFDAYVAMWRGLRRLLREAAPGADGSLFQAHDDARAGAHTDSHTDPHTDPHTDFHTGANTDTNTRRGLNARTHLLLSQLLWSRAWLTRFEPADFPRVAVALCDVLLNGLAAPGQRWAPHTAAAAAPLAPGVVPAVVSAVVPAAVANVVPAAVVSAVPAAMPEPEADKLADAYLRTATRLINDHGVGGASVERIAATLALTKGSFYHHHDTKHGLVDACFERSFALIRRVQLAALSQPGNGWQRLLAATLPLVALHDDPNHNGAGPLLRLTAWTELPDALRWRKWQTLNRLGERYAAMITAGMIDGSVRMVDPAVAAQMVCGLVNALGEAGHWVSPGGDATLGQLLARPLLCGLLADVEHRPDVYFDPAPAPAA